MVNLGVPHGKVTPHVVWCRYLTCTVIDVAACLDDVAYNFTKTRTSTCCKKTANIL